MFPCTITYRTFSLPYRFFIIATHLYISPPQEFTYTNRQLHRSLCIKMPIRTVSYLMLYGISCTHSKGSCSPLLKSLQLINLLAPYSFVRLVFPFIALAPMIGGPKVPTILGVRSYPFASPIVWFFARDVPLAVFFSLAYAFTAVCFAILSRLGLCTITHLSLYSFRARLLLNLCSFSVISLFCVYV